MIDIVAFCEQDPDKPHIPIKGRILKEFIAVGASATNHNIEVFPIRIRHEEKSKLDEKCEDE
jgi:hypothetical protein